MTHQLDRLPRACILAAASAWLGLALRAAPAWAGDENKFSLKGKKITAAALKGELFKACLEQTKPETVYSPVRFPPVEIELTADFGNYTLCLALGAGSEAPCAAAKQAKESCVEGYHMHQILMQNDPAAATSACLRMPGVQTQVEPGRQSEACKLISEMIQDGDIDAGCGKVQALFKDQTDKKKRVKECVRTWKFLDGADFCDNNESQRAVECGNYVRLRSAAKARNAKECGDWATCLAAMTHSTDSCATILPPGPPKELANAPPESVESQKVLNDYCQLRAADQEERELSEDALFRVNTGRRDYKAGEPLLHLLPPGELPPVQPWAPLAPATPPTQPPLDPPRK